MPTQIHDALVGPDAVHPAAFIQSADPALSPGNNVGPYKLWIDVTSPAAPVIKYRDGTNSSWQSATIDQPSNDARYVNIDGDVMTGALTVPTSVTVTNGRLSLTGTNAGVAASLYRHATYGLVAWGVTGSNSDLTLLNNNGN